jgi:hypothetical protein
VSRAATAAAASAANLSRAAASAAASAANLSRAAQSAAAQSRLASRNTSQAGTPAPTSSASVRAGSSAAAAANQTRQTSRAQSAAPASRAQPSPSAASTNSVVEVIFKSIDRQNHGRISVEDAEKILLRLNSRLNRKYGEDDVQAFFSALDVNQDQTIDLDEFRGAFRSLNVA